jgi:hypothetical protein
VLKQLPHHALLGCKYESRVIRLKRCFLNN